MTEIKNHRFIEGLYYSKDFLWVRLENDTVTIGLTDYAQGKLKQIYYVELPNSGSKVSQCQTLGTVESMKAVADVIAPLSGTVKSINSGIAVNPTLINEDPYGRGWLIEIRPTNLKGELSRLMDFSEAISWYKSLTRA